MSEHTAKRHKISEQSTKFFETSNLPTIFSAASKRDVHIRLMLSERAYTYKHRKEHLLSLLEYNKHLRKILFEVKVFHVSFVKFEHFLFL